MQEKLHKVLARAGQGSRRQLEQLIAQGRIMVNGRIAQLGDRVTLGHPLELRIDQRPVRLTTLSDTVNRVLLYHKPEGELVTHSDPQGRPTVFERLPLLSMARWIAVGRLDINTSGLLLLTTHGELAHRLMHPRYAIEREYAVRVFGSVDQAMLLRLRQGVLLEDGLAQFHTLTHQSGQGLNQWFRVTLTEGRQHEVRRLWLSQGVQVSRLIRTRYATVGLPEKLAPGHWTELSFAACQTLAKQVSLDLRC